MLWQEYLLLPCRHVLLLDQWEHQAIANRIHCDCLNNLMLQFFKAIIKESIFLESECNLYVGWFFRLSGDWIYSYSYLCLLLCMLKSNIFIYKEYPHLCIQDLLHSYRKYFIVFCEFFFIAITISVFIITTGETNNW